MTCPKCGSADPRPSERRLWSDVPRRILGLDPWRCHKCSKRFHARSTGAGRRHKPRAVIHARRRRRRLIEVAVFSLLLIIFLLFLRYMTREPVPAAESGELPHFNALGRFPFRHAGDDYTVGRGQAVENLDQFAG